MAQEIGVILTVKGAQNFVTSLLKAQGQLNTLADGLLQAADTIQQFESELRKQGGAGEELFDRFKLGNVVGEISLAKNEVVGLGASLRQLSLDISSEIKPKNFEELVKALKLTKEEARDFVTQFAQFDEETKQASEGLDGAAASAKTAGEAFKTIDLEQIASLNFQNLITNMESLAQALGKLGAVSREYKNDIASPIFNLVTQFNNVNPSKIESTEKAINSIITLFEKDVSPSAGDIKVDVAGLNDIVDGIRGFSGLSVANIKKILGLNEKFSTFFKSFAELKPSMTTRLDLLVNTLERIDKLQISERITVGLTKLTNALNGFVKRISGKFVRENIDITIDAFNKFITVVSNLGDAGGDTATLNQLAGKFNLISNAIAPLTTLVSVFGTTFQPVVEKMAQLSTALQLITKVAGSELDAALQTSVGALINFSKKLSEGVGDVAQFSSDLLNITDALKKFADSISSLAGRTTIDSFANKVGSLITAFNRLAKELDVTDFLKNIIPFSKELQNLADVITGLNKVVGKGTLANIVAVDLTQEKQKLQDAKNTSAALALQNKELRNNERALEKAARVAKKAAEKQRELNDAYAINTLKSSTNVLDRFIGKMREANAERQEMIEKFGKPISTSITVKLEVLGIQAFTRLVSLFTIVPVKAVLLFSKALLGLFNVLKNAAVYTVIKGFQLLGKAIIGLGIALKTIAVNTVVKGFNLLVGTVRVLYNIIKPLVNIILNLAVAISKLVIWFAKLPFRIVASGFSLIGKVIKGIITFIFNIVVAFAKLFIWFVKLIPKITMFAAAVKILLLPVRLLTDALNLFVRGSKNLNSELSKTQNQTNKTAQEMNDLQQETIETADAQQVLQVEMSDTEKRLQEAQLGAQRTTNALQGVGLAANAVNLAKTFLAGRTIAIAVKQIFGLTLALKAANVVSRALNTSFQRVRFELTNLTRLAIDAVSQYELLTLSLESLTRLEFQELGLGEINFGEAFGKSAEIVGNNIDNVNVKVQELLRWVRILAIQSPFEEEDVAKILQYGIALGFSSDESKRLTQAIVDFGAGAGKSISEMESIIRALGQMKNNGFLAKEELNQLSEAGFRKPLEALVNAIPELETTADALEAISDKAITGADAVEIFTRRLESDFAGSAIKATQTLSGLISTLISLRKGILREFSAPVFDFLKPLVASFTGTEQIDQLLISARQLGEVFANKVQVAITNVTKVIGTFVGLIQAIPKPIKALIKEFTRFAVVAISVSVGMSIIKTAIAAAIVVFGVLINPLTLTIGLLVAFYGTVKKLGQLVSPVFKSVGDSFTAMYNVIKPGLKIIGDLFVAAFNRVFNILNTVVKKMFGYGQNIGISLANGIVSAVSYVVSAINVIAKQIAYWLMPGSPPRALPNIDHWGTAAANEYLLGFESADFDIIEDFGLTLGELVEALELPAGTIDVNDIQQDFAELIASLNDGDVPEFAITSFFTNLSKEVQVAEKDFSNLAIEYVNIAIEQAKLNKLTDEYNERLAETNSQIDEIERNTATLDEEARLKEINRILNNKYATTENKERAELERKKIIAEQSKREIEKQQSIVDSQKESLDVLKKRIGLDKKLSDPLDTLDSGAGAGAGALDKLPKEKLEKIKDEAGELEIAFDDAAGSIGNISSALKNLELPKLNFSDIFNEAKGKVQERLEELNKTLARFGINARNAKIAATAFFGFLILPSVVNGVRLLATNLGLLLKPFLAIAGSGPVAATLLAIGAALVFVGAPKNLQDLQNLGKGIQDFFTNLQSGYLNEKPKTFTNLEDFFTSIQNFNPGQFGTKLGGTLSVASKSIKTFSDSVQSFIGTARLTASTKGGAGFESLNDFFNSFGKLNPNVFAAKLGNSFSEIVSKLQQNFTLIRSNLTTLINENIISPFTEGFNVNFEASLGEKIINGIFGVFSTIGPKIQERLSAISSTLREVLLNPFLAGFESSDTDAALREKISNAISAAFTSAIEFLNVGEIRTSLINKFKEIFTFEFDVSGLTIFGGLETFSFADIFNNLTASIPTEVIEAFNFIWDRFKENLTATDLPQKLLVLAGSLGELALKIGIVIGAIAGFIAIFTASIFAEIPVIFGGIVDAVTGLVEIFNGLIDVVVGIGELIIAAIKGEGVSEALNNLGEDFTRVFDGIKQIVEGASDVIEGILNSLTNVRQFIVGLMGGDMTGPMLDEFRAQTAVVSDILAELLLIFLTWRTKIFDWAYSIGTRFRSLGTGIRVVVEGIKKLFGGGAAGSSGIFAGFFPENSKFVNLFNNFRKIKDFFSGESLTDGISTFFDTISSNIQLKIDNLELAFTTFKDNVTTSFTTAGDNVKLKIDEITLNFATFKDNAAIAIDSIISKMIEIGTTVINDPFSIIRTTIDGLIEVHENLLQKILDFVAATTGIVIPNPFTTLRETLDAIPEIITTVRDAFSQFSDFLGSLTLPNPLSALQEGIENVTGWLDFRNAKEDAAEGGKDVAKSVATSTETELNNSKVTIKPDFVEVNSADFEDTGRPIIQGAVKGVEDESSSQESRNALQRAGDNIKGLWNSVWDTNSPSTVARDEMGLPIAQGVIEGIEIGFDEVSFDAAHTAITNSFNTYSDETGPELGKSFAANIIDGMREALSTLDLNSAVAEGTGDESASPLQNILTLDTATTASLLEKFTILFSQIMEALENFVEEFNEEFATFMELMLEALEEHVETVVEIVEDTFATIIEMLVAFAIRVVQILEKLMSDIERIMRKFEQIMRDAAKAGIDAFIEALEDFGERVKNKLIEQINLILEELKTKFFDTGKELGKKMVDGIIEAILNALPDLTAAGESAAAAVEAGVKKGSDIASPSKVMKRLGAFMMDGLKAGILGNASDLTASALNVVNDMTQTLQDETTKLDISLELPVKLRYDGIKDSLPALTQDVNMSNSGIRSGIAAMQNSANASVINNNQSYTMNLTVRQDQVADVRRNFNKMQQLRI